MLLTSLRLRNFRNHLDSTFDFGIGTNLLLGENGHGKTNVLEAISCLCLSKSFFGAHDSLCLNCDSELFEIDGSFLTDGGSEQAVRVRYVHPEPAKTVTIGGHAVEPFSSIVGQFPVVICSPDRAPITTGGPGERRRFVDFVISQASAVYFQDLLAYRKVLRHRNALLQDRRLSREDSIGALQPWNLQLAKIGSRLICRRRDFVREFREFMTAAYCRVAGGNDGAPSLTYRSVIDDVPESATAGEIEVLLCEQLLQRASDEFRAAATLVGPQRDEFVFRLDELELRKFASQGQHKTFLIALKLGEFFYLKERRGERPILLLDDIFSELDQGRAGRLLEYVGSLGQTFITSTDPGFFPEMASGSDRRFFVRRGSVIPALAEKEAAA